MYSCLGGKQTAGDKGSWVVMIPIFTISHSYTGRQTVVTKTSHNMTKFKMSLGLSWTTAFSSGEMTAECLVAVLNKQIKSTLHTFTSVLCWKSGSPGGPK